MTTKKFFGKRILSLALVLLLVLSLIPTSVMATDTDQLWLDSSVTATKDGITLYIPEVYCDDCGENVQDAELVIDSVDYAVGTLRVKYHLGHHPCFEIYTKSNTISINDFDCTTEYNEYPVYANAWDQTTSEPVAYLSREAGHIFDEGESGICTFCGETVQTGWVYDSGNWYYYYEDGTMATNVVISNENDSYYFGSDGALVVNQMVQVDGVWYQAAEDGRLEPLEIDTHNYVNGFCTVCDAFEPATDENEDGVYEISNAGQLYWFADKVNNDYENFGSANAILTADIVVNEGTVTESSTDARVWTPIGNWSNKYTGAFDGNDYSVSGLYFNDSEVHYVGLFGVIGENGAVKNTGVINSYFNADECVGGVSGYNFGTVTNCYSTAEISADKIVGGIVGCNYGIVANSYNTGKVNGNNGVSGVVGVSQYGTIINCYNTGEVSGTSNVGGILGESYSATIANCYNTGTVNGNYYFGAIFGYGRNYDASNCYYLDSSCSFGTGDDSVYGPITSKAKTSEAFASGEVAYLLQSEQIESVWGQKIGTDTAPVLGGDKVYTVNNCKDEVAGYSNTEGEILDHDFENGFCTVCDAFEPATDENEDGVYEISNAGQLYWFADKVNNDNANFGSANAILTADIVVNEGTMSAESEGARVWTPIGNFNSKYSGSFDGNNKTVSGLYLNESSKWYVGLFGFVYNGTVKNTGVINSYFCGSNDVGAIAGVCNSGEIINCYNESIVVGNSYTGGVVGYNEDSTMTDCYNSGNVSGKHRIAGVVGFNQRSIISNTYNTGVIGTGECVGGIVGESDGGAIESCYNAGEIIGRDTYRVGGIIGQNRNGSVDNCYNIGTVDGTDSMFVGGIAGNNIEGTITNCYYLNTACEGGIDGSDLAGSAEAKTAEQFKDGEVAYLLQGEQEELVWGQKIGTDTAPVLGGDKVYYGYTSCAYDAEMVYTNTEASDVRPAHKELRAEFDWNTPYDGECYVSVELYCTECGSYVDSDSGYATIKETVEAQDCMHDGYELYEITLEYKGVTYTDTKKFTLKSDNHIGEVVNGFCSECGGYQKPEVDPGDDPEWGYDDVYLIYNAGQLYWFADYINNVRNDAYAKLEADIVVNETLDENSRVWTPIMDFYGNFDGNCHTVSGLYVKSEEDQIGMFGGGYYSYGTVENLGLINSYFEGNDNVGGIAGYHAGTIKNCYVTDTVTVVGNNLTGTLVGYNAGTVSNCYAYAFTLVGSYHSSYATVENCYYLADTDDGKGGKTAEQFKSGEVAYLLQSGVVGEEIWDDELGEYVQTDPEHIWGQKIGEDTYPVFGGDKVYTVNKCNDEVVGYSNTEGEILDHDFENGFCTVCDGFEPATLNEDGVYEIANAGQLYWFAEYVNAGNTSANAILTADIVVNEGRMTAESADVREWTPIGNSSTKYTGTFNGNDHTVSGLYFNKSEVSYGGLFGYVGENGAVKNTGVVDSYFCGYWYVGGVVGSCRNGTISNCYNTSAIIGQRNVGGVVCYIFNGTVTNCYNTGAVNGIISDAGGVVGSCENATISNCYNTGTVNGGEYVGGVVGYTYDSTVANCYNTGIVDDGTNYVGGAVGYAYNGTITNCYYLDTAFGGGINGKDVAGSAEAKTSEQFASGEVAYLLQGEQTEDVWGQKIGEDTYPVFGGDKVYTVNNCNDEVVGYSNTEGEILDHVFENGFCTLCDIFEPATLNEDGVYEIGNAGQLYWFAEYVNAGNVSANAILTADIVVNEGTVTESSTDERVWTPIGNWSNKYTGAFDGNDYTVSGLYFNDSEVHYVGLFGVIGENGAVKNTGVINSYFNADECVGGVSGYNFGTVTNCYNTAEISADKIVGGIVGCNYGIVANSYNTGKVNGNNGVSGVVGVSQYGTIINCYNTGEVSGTSNVGGILGESYSATIANCYNTGTVNGNYYFGAIFGYGRNYDASNCYYLDSSCSFGTGDDSVYGPITSKAKTSEAFASGEVAYLLQSEQIESVWGQKIGTDLLPTLGGNRVYAITDSDGNITGYTNTVQTDQLAGYSLSLGDKIAVNYYMSLTEITFNDANAKMVFTVPDTGSTYTLEIPVSEAVKSGDYYVFTCEVAAKEMTSAISAKLITSESELQLDDYTVQEYAEVILSDTVKYAKEQELVKAMLNYGTQAQKYFDYNTDSLANDTELMTEEEKTVELYGFAGAPYTITGEEAGVTYYGTALSLETELMFKHYFIIDESVDTQSLEITCDYPVTLKKNGSFYELIISDIPAHKMGEGSLKVSLGGITLDYTIYSYGALAQNSGNEELWTVVSALAHFAGEATMYAYK